MTMATLEELTRPYELTVPGSLPIRVQITPAEAPGQVVVELDGHALTYELDAMVPRSSEPGAIVAWHQLRERAQAVLYAAAIEERERRAGMTLDRAKEIHERLWSSGSWALACVVAGTGLDDHSSTARMAMDRWRDTCERHGVPLEDASRAVYVLDGAARAGDMDVLGRAAKGVHPDRCRSLGL
jgi:hypothetical protein